MFIKFIKYLFESLSKYIKLQARSSEFNRHIIITEIQGKTVFGLRGVNRGGRLKFYHAESEPVFGWSNVPQDVRPFEWSDGEIESDSKGDYLAFQVAETAVPGKYLYSSIGSPAFQVEVVEDGGLLNVEFKVAENLVTPLITLDNKADLFFENITGKIRLKIIPNIFESTGGGEIEIDIIPEP